MADMPDTKLIEQLEADYKEIYAVSDPEKECALYHKWCEEISAAWPTIRDLALSALRAGPADLEAVAQFPAIDPWGDYRNEAGLFDIERFISKLTWSASATEHEKTLVIGNLRNLYAVLKPNRDEYDAMLRASSSRPSAQAVAEAVRRAIADHIVDLGEDDTEARLFDLAPILAKLQSINANRRIAERRTDEADYWNFTNKRVLRDRRALAAPAQPNSTPQTCKAVRAVKGGRYAEPSEYRWCSKCGVLLKDEDPCRQYVVAPQPQPTQRKE